MWYAQKKTLLLPHPYSTNCKIYPHFSYQTKTHCFEQCIVGETKRHCQGYPNALNIISNEHLKFIDMNKECYRNADIRNICKQRCYSPDCEKEFISFGLKS